MGFVLQADFASHSKRGSAILRARARARPAIRRCADRPRTSLAGKYKPRMEQLCTARSSTGRTGKSRSSRARYESLDGACYDGDSQANAEPTERSEDGVRDGDRARPQERP